MSNKEVNPVPVKEPKTFVALISKDSSEIISGENGIAFAVSELEYRQWEVIFVATSRADAQTAIVHYQDQQVLRGFTSPNRYR